MTYARAFTRLLRRQPGLSLLAVLTLGLGIGLATVLFSIVYGLVLRPLPFPDADRLVAVQLDGGSVDAGSFRRWEEEAATFEEMAAFSMSYFFVTGTTGGTQTHAGAEVTADFLKLVRVSPVIGRPLLPEDMVPGAAPVAVISHQVWQDLLGGRADVLGQSVRINRILHTVIGVMPRHFEFPHSQGVWRPLALSGVSAPGQGPSVEVVGRLREGVETSQAEQELARLADAKGVNVEPFVRAHTDRRVRRALPLMAVAVLGVLLIACVNVANLFLVRVLRQRHELAVAAALGADRFRMPARILGEILGLTGLGAILGLILAQAGIWMFNAAMEPAGVFDAFWAEVKMEPTVALFTLPVAIVACALAAALPILHVLRTEPAAVLREHSGGSSSPIVGLVSRGLVLTEVALACGLLVLAGLMIESVANLRGPEEGFDSKDLLTARISIFQDAEMDADGALAFFNELTDALEADRRIERVGFATSIPTRGSFWSPLNVEGGVESSPERIRWLVVSDGFFEALDVPILAGRDIERTDIALFPEVAIINQSFADRFFPGRSPVGRRLRFPGDDTPWKTIVGVVPNLTMGDVDDEQSPAAVYLPLAQEPRSSMEAVLEVTHGEPASLIPTLESKVTEVEPLATVFYAMPMDEVLRRRHWLHEALATSFTVFGLVALVLSAVGLGGIVAVVARSNRRAHGIRLALGASPGRILSAVLRSALLQATIGLGIGLILAAFLARWISSQVFGVEAWEPTVYGGVVLVLLVTTILAVLAPAIRAAKTEPKEVLREP